MGTLQSISNESVKPSDRIPLFKDMVWNVFHVEPKVISSTPLTVAMEYGNLGDIGLCRVRASGQNQLARSGAKRSDAYLKIVLQVKGTSYYQQRGRNVLMAPRQWSIFELTEPDFASSSDNTETLALTLPQEKVLSWRYNLGDLTARAYSGHVGTGKLVWDFISSVFDAIPNLDPQSEPDLLEPVSHLLRLALAEISGCPTVRSCEKVLRDRIRSYVLNHLRDPELSIDRMATALNCTKRYLHRAFQDEGVSISDYIWQLRLDRCRNEIVDSRYQSKSITEIAFSWGFNSSPHFSAAFKERFGTSPKVCRREQKQ
jgi:AraC-like DNA-binding protein